MQTDNIQAKYAKVTYIAEPYDSKGELIQGKWELFEEERDLNDKIDQWFIEYMKLRPHIYTQLTITIKN